MKIDNVDYRELNGAAHLIMIMSDAQAVNQIFAGCEYTSDYNNAAIDWIIADLHDNKLDATYTDYYHYYLDKATHIIYIDNNYDAAVYAMDDDLRESIHAFGIDDKTEFLTIYLIMHEIMFGEEFTL